MSAYGAIQRSSQPNLTAPILPTIWTHKKHGRSIVIFHIPSGHATLLESSLRTYLYSEFADEVDRGNTYPQEVIGDPSDTNATNARYTQDSFESYFFGADFFLGISVPGDMNELEYKEIGNIEGVPVRATPALELEHIRAGRKWEDCVAGYYYVRPTFWFFSPTHC